MTTAERAETAEHDALDKTGTIRFAALPPVRSEPLLDVAKRLRDAWSMIDNALDGLAMRGEKDSPLVRDLREAQAEVETSRQAIYAHTSNKAISGVGH